MIEPYIPRLTHVLAARVTSENARDIAAWCGGDITVGYASRDTEARGVVFFKENRGYRANLGEYVVQIDGEFFTMPAAAFERYFREEPTP